MVKLPDPPGGIVCDSGETCIKRFGSPGASPQAVNVVSMRSVVRIAVLVFSARFILVRRIDRKSSLKELRQIK